MHRQRMLYTKNINWATDLLPVYIAMIVEDIQIELIAITLIHTKIIIIKKKCIPPETFQSSLCKNQECTNSGHCGKGSKLPGWINGKNYEADMPRFKTLHLFHKLNILHVTRKTFLFLTNFHLFKIQLSQLIQIIFNIKE